VRGGVHLLTALLDESESESAVFVLATRAKVSKEQVVMMVEALVGLAKQQQQQLSTTTDHASGQGEGEEEEAKKNWGPGEVMSAMPSTGGPHPPAARRRQRRRVAGCAGWGALGRSGAGHRRLGPGLLARRLRARVKHVSVVRDGLVTATFKHVLRLSFPVRGVIIAAAPPN
jgi:hypothetical protein